MLKVTLVGTGGTMPLPERALACLALSVGGRNILIDCGEGTQVAAKNAGISLYKIDLICLTHYHGDHIFGLPGLLQTMGSLGRVEPVLITGPEGLQEVIKPILCLCQGLPFAVNLQTFCVDAPETQSHKQGDVALGDMLAPVEGLAQDSAEKAKSMSKKQAALVAQQAADAAIKVKSAGETVCDIAGLGVTLNAFPLSHRVPTVGYKITLPRVGKFLPEKALALGVPQRCWGKLQKGEAVQLPDGSTIVPSQVLGEARSGLSVVYGTDTRICKGLHLAAKDADLLICDSTYPSDEYKEKAKEFGHSTFVQVAKLAATQQAKRLWLTHFSAAVPEPAEHLQNATAYYPDAEIGVDGKSIDLVFEG